MFGLKHKVDGFGLQYCTINLEGLACCRSCTRHSKMEMATLFFINGNRVVKMEI